MLPKTKRAWWRLRMAWIDYRLSVAEHRIVVQQLKEQQLHLRQYLLSRKEPTP